LELVLNNMTALEQALAALNAALRDKYHSMAQYVLEAGPYVRPGQEAVLGELRTMADADRALADRLAEAMERLEGIPQPGTPDPEVANLNYLSLNYLLGYLKDSVEKQLSRYENDLPLLRDFPAAGEVFDRLLAATRAQAARLRDMSDPKSSAQ